MRFQDHIPFSMQVNDIYATFLKESNLQYDRLLSVTRFSMVVSYTAELILQPKGIYGIGV